MPASKAQQRAVNKYMRENYDRINLTAPKGKKDIIQSHAATRGESANAFINRAIDQAIAQDNAGVAGGPQEAGPGILTPSVLKAAQEAAEAAGETLPAFVARAVETQAKQDSVSRRMKGGKPNE